MLPSPDQNQTVRVSPPLTRNTISDIVCSPQEVIYFKSLDVTNIKQLAPIKYQIIFSNTELSHCVILCQKYLICVHQDVSNQVGISPCSTDSQQRKKSK